MRRQPDNWRKWAMWLGWLICLEHSWTSLCQILRLLFWKDGWMVVVGCGWWWMDATLDVTLLTWRDTDPQWQNCFSSEIKWIILPLSIEILIYPAILAIRRFSYCWFLFSTYINLYQPISCYIPYIPYWIDEWMWHVQQKIFNRGLWHFLTQYPVRSGIMLMTHHFKWLVKMGWFMKSGLPH